MSIEINETMFAPGPFAPPWMRDRKFIIEKENFSDEIEFYKPCINRPSRNITARSYSWTTWENNGRMLTKAFESSSFIMRQDWKENLIRLDEWGGSSVERTGRVIFQCMM